MRRNLIALFGLAWFWGCTAGPEATTFTSAEVRAIASRALSELPPPIDLTNAIATDERAIEFGQRLFFEAELSINGEVACATCHDPNKGFGDGLSQSEGIGTTQRHAPHLFHVAQQRWFYWDGRVDTLWGQALVPLEHPDEMGNNRTTIVSYILNHPDYGPTYQALFGAPDAATIDALSQPAKPVPDDPTDPYGIAWANLDEAAQYEINKAFSNIGKVIAAYEMTFTTTNSPFDEFAKSLDEKTSSAPSKLSLSAIRGLKLFMSSANCHLCHTGPLFSDREFHNLGFEPLDIGRTGGVELAQEFQFSSLGPFSDDPEGQKATHLAALISGHITDGAFKTPSLRNVAMTAPYMHDGRFATLEEVVRFYNEMPPKTGPGDRELFLTPLGLSPSEEADIVAFLKSLSEPPPLN